MSNLLFAPEGKSEIIAKGIITKCFCQNCDRDEHMNIEQHLFILVKIFYEKRVCLVCGHKFYFKRKLLEHKK